MNTRTHHSNWAAWLMALFLLFGPTLGAVADDNEDDDDRNWRHSHRGTLEGTWRTIEDGFDLGELEALGFPDINGLRGLFTFSAGANSPDGGTVVHTDPGFLGGACLPLQGVWQRTGRVWQRKGRRTFIGTDENFCSGFALRTRYKIELDRSGNSFEDADYVIDVLFDVDGPDGPGGPVVVGSVAGKLHGERMKPEAP